MGESENRWEGKPFRAFVIRAFAFLAPVAAALFVAWWLSNVIPRPSGWGMFALWWLSILVISTVVLRVTERFARKLLPLAALLKLTLVFPDRAPDRFTMSMRTGGAETLEEMAEQAQAASEQDDFATAAETILALAARLNSHDPRTRGHAERVRAYADMIAEEMGFDDEDRNKVKWACMLHDIGKLKVPLEIINKPGRLTDEEYDVIKNHPTWGMELAEPLLPWLGDFASGIGQHHERFDGFGYPNGISGVEIGLAGRIAAVADTFDVITSVRSYKQARPASEAREELARCAGSQFDPEVVRAFLNIGLGRQRWVAGPLSWLGQIPMVQSAVQGFTTLATNAGAVASTAATATALGAAAIVAPNMFPAAPAPIELPATAIVVAADDFGRVNENGVITLDSLGNDQGDIASSRVIVDPANGTAQILNNQIVYTPNPGFSGIDSVEYEICNDQGECDTAIVTITVDATNRAPVQIGSTAAGVEDETLFIDPTTLVSDPEDSLDRSSLRVIGAPGSGVATVTAAGDIRYVPGPDFNGTDTITYEICDTDGLCLTETVIVTIEPANDLPEVTVSPVSGSEDSPVFIGVDAVDPDGDPVSTFIDSAPANGSVEVGIDGNIIYTPDPDFFGVDSFDISVCDPSGGCETLTISVPITGVNDSPVVPDRSFTTDEDTLLVFDPIAGITDPDGDTITMTGFDATSTAGGTITQGSLQYLPPANYAGPDSFTYTISDGTVSINVPVLVTVADVNDLPTGAPASLNPIEDQTVVFDLLGAFADADGDPIAVSGVAIAPATAGALTFVGGILTVDPADDFVGTITVSYTVSDGIASIPSTLQLIYSAVNDLPVLVDDISGVAGAPVSVDVLANDSDVEGLDVATLAIVTPPSAGTAIVSGAEIIYTPPIAFSGTTSLVYQVCDIDGACDTATLTIDVNAPVGVDDAFDVPEDSAGTPLDVIANDLDADSNLDSSTLLVLTPAGNGTTALASGKIVYKPAADHDTTDSFSYQVCDAEGSCTTATVSITMNPLNDDAPVATDDAASITEVETGYSGAGVVVNVLANDSDADTLDSISVVAIDAPVNGTLTDLGGGDYEYLPNADFSGTESLNYTIQDSSGSPASAVLTITVTATPDDPVANDDAVDVAEDAGVPVGLGVLANDTDPDGLADIDTASLTILTGPTDGTAALAAGDITYQPNANFDTTDTLTYQVCDFAAACDTATVSISMNPVDDDLPVAVDDAGTFTEVEAGYSGPGLIVNVLANDSDADTLDSISVVAIDAAANGTLTDLGGGGYSYVPNADFSGTETLNYTINDSSGDAASAVLTITVTGTPDDPVANDDAVDVAEDSAAVGLGVLANDTDPDGLADIDTASLTILTGPTDGTAALVSGDITYLPNPDFDGTDLLTYQVCDFAAACDTATVSITITPPNNDGPDAVNDAVSFTEVEPGFTGPGVIFNVLANDTDPDTGDTLAVLVIDLPGNGALIDLGSGVYEYVPDANFFGTESLSYTVVDAASASDSAVVTITVANTPDAPVVQDDAYSSTVLGALVIEAAPGVLINDTDYDSDPLTVVSMTQRVGDTGILAWNAVGSFTYSPPALFIGKVFLDYTVSDGALTDDGVITITIDPGIIAAGSYFGPALYADGFGFQPTPPDGTVTDPDFDSNPGLTIAEGGLDIDETDPTQYVRWYAAAGPTGTEYNGPISLELWSSHVGFDASGGSGHIAVHLRDCAPDGTACGPSLLSYDQHIGDWNGGVADFVYREIALGDLSYTLPAGRVLQAQVMFAHASMWVATHAPYNSQLVITEANLPPEDPEGSDAFVVDEDSTTAAPANTFDVLADDTDIDLDPNSLTINVAPINGTAVVNGSNEIEYTPNANFYSDAATDDFKYQICDATPACTIVDVFVTVSPVNDVPVFILPVAPVSVLEDDGGVTVNNFATPAVGNIFEGALNESAQDHTFIVAAVDPTAFANQPVINADGRLQFTLQDDVHGTYGVDVYLTDDGGTPGVDTSPTQTFSIVAAPVNDEPSWVDTDVSVAEFTGSGTFEHVIVGYTTPVTGPAGPNVDESAQTATFTLTDNTDNPTLFAVAPTIDASGTLRFTMAAQAFGQADVGFTMSDDGGTLNAGVNTGSEQTFQIEVVENDEPPVISTNNAVILNSGQTALISSSDLESTDPDNPPAELGYSLTTPLTLGQFLNGGLPGDGLHPGRDQRRSDFIPVDWRRRNRVSRHRRR